MISYLGNFTEDATVYIMFNTFSSNDPSASCTITNFINTDVHIHKDDGLTQRNNAAGITVSVDFDGITGSHMVKIDTSDDTVAGFWIAGHEYFVRIEGTTIDGATINSVVGQFSIENRHNEVDVVKISGDSTAANNLELDYDGTGYVKANSTIGTCTTNTDIGAAGASLTDLGGMSTGMKAEIESEANDALVVLELDHFIHIAVGLEKPTVQSYLDLIMNKNASQNYSRDYDSLEANRDRGDSAWITATSTTVSDKTGFALSSTGADLILKNSIFALAIADAVADEEYTGATHNVVNSLARRVREIGAFAIHAGTAQAGAINSITLAATADANDGVYNRNLIVLVDNTGVSQTRTIVDYNGTTKIAVIDRDWRILPDATTVYQITPDNTPLVVDQGVAQAGTSTTITLRSYASAIDDNYLCNIVIIIAGTGRGQARLVGSYVGSTKVVTICGDNWITIPDNTSIYVMIPYGATCVSCINNHALDQIDTVCDTALTNYDSPTRTEATTDKNAIITEIDANETKIDTLQTDLTAVKAKTDSLPSGPAKNVALPKFDFLMVLSSDGVTGATGKTVTGEISKDGTSFVALTNSITEVSDGMYAMLAGLTQAEMNVDVFTLKFSATDCLDRIITVHTT